MHIDCHCPCLDPTLLRLALEQSGAVRSLRWLTSNFEASGSKASAGGEISALVAALGDLRGVCLVPDVYSPNHSIPAALCKPALVYLDTSEHITSAGWAIVATSCKQLRYLRVDAVVGEDDAGLRQLLGANPGLREVILCDRWRTSTNAEPLVNAVLRHAAQLHSLVVGDCADNGPPPFVGLPASPALKTLHLIVTDAANLIGAAHAIGAGQYPALRTFRAAVNMDDSLALDRMARALERFAVRPAGVDTRGLTRADGLRRIGHRLRRRQ